MLEVKIIGGDFHSKTEFIPRITLSLTEDKVNLSFRLNRRQFPIRLAFSITINKAWGRSVGRVGVDLRIPVFSHGQLYVVLSHATNSQNIRVHLPNDQEDAQMTNVVYPEVLVGVNDFSVFPFTPSTCLKIRGQVTASFASTGLSQEAQGLIFW